jgi:hypothetical protein
MTESSTCSCRPNCRPASPDSCRHERRCIRFQTPHSPAFPGRGSAPNGSGQPAHPAGRFGAGFSERSPQSLGRSGQVAPKVSNELSNYCGADRQPPLDDPGSFGAPGIWIDARLACFTPKRSLVRTQYRPPSESHVSLPAAHPGSHLSDKLSDYARWSRRLNSRSMTVAPV